MCRDLNVYGIIAGVLGATAILVTTYIDKHNADAHVAPPAITKTVQVTPPVSLAIGRDGVRVDINLSL